MQNSRISNSLIMMFYRTLQDCSRDRNTEKLAIRHSLDLVISSSGLSCLIDNHSPSYSRQWEMPIVVKEYTVNGTLVK